VVTDQSVDCVSPTRSAARRASLGLQGACAQAKFIPVINDRLEQAISTIGDESPYHRTGFVRAKPFVSRCDAFLPITISVAKADLHLLSNGMA
jgi:hypothetical protein